MIPVPEIRDFVMVDDHEGDIQIAKLCYARSELSNPFVAFADSHQFLAYLSVCQIDPRRFPAIVIVAERMQPLSGLTVLQRVREIFGGNPPFQCVIVTNDTTPAKQQQLREAVDCEILVRPRTIHAYVEFFNSLAVVPA